MHKLTYNSDGYLLGLEEQSPQDLARQMLAWYARTKPKSLDQLSGERGEELKFMARAIEGAFITIGRIADEQAQVLAKGFLTLNVSPQHGDHEFPEGAVEKD